MLRKQNGQKQTQHTQTYTHKHSPMSRERDRMVSTILKKWCRGGKRTDSMEMKVVGTRVLRETEGKSSETMKGKD